MPGLVLSNHEQWAQGCLFQNLTLEDSAGNVVEKPKNSVPRNERIGRHLLEFIADDGKRVKAEW